MSVKIEESWKQVLAPEFNAEYFLRLSNFVKEAYKNGKIFPPPKEIFRAFDLCPFLKTKVVIIGQDPYHGQGQANGLCFAVSEKIPVPPSLQNIFKEIKNDLGYEPERNGDLSRWARQGVLLLNATLTVQEGKPGSHQGKGWEDFTDAVIKHLSLEREGLVFFLWGNYAKKKGSIIDRSKHLVLEAPHPSPFSVQSGFFGSKHFSQANRYLESRGEASIDWR